MLLRASRTSALLTKEALLSSLVKGLGKGALGAASIPLKYPKTALTVGLTGLGTHAALQQNKGGLSRQALHAQKYGPPRRVQYASQMYTR